MSPSFSNRTEQELAYIASFIGAYYLVPFITSSLLKVLKTPWLNTIVSLVVAYILARYVFPLILSYGLAQARRAR